VLDFDHLGEKSYNVSDAIARVLSWARIELEIAKCEVVCANCHRIRTHERRTLAREVQGTTLPS
jgi:hypothetical protein